jgi:hypothetical protein
MFDHPTVSLTGSESNCVINRFSTAKAGRNQPANDQGDECEDHNS